MTDIGDIDIVVGPPRPDQPGNPDRPPTKPKSPEGGIILPPGVDPEPEPQTAPEPAPAGDDLLGNRILELVEPQLEGADVAAWQRIIQTDPIFGRKRLDEGGVFGPMTDTITRVWQVEHGLYPDGIVGPETLLSARQVTEPEGKPRPYPTTEDVKAAVSRRIHREKKERP